MRLQKLVINGFKSFAVKTIFEFGPGLTAIVGPNGSGKSNVADGVRWVLGEQSLKLIRGKKSEDVIYGGSKQLSRLGMAQVDLYIDNADRRLPIDFSEVVISRRVFRTGESEYYINKSKVRLADILMLLAKANVGQKSYAVIGQGMIDEILNSSPQDRKTFFDEATGVKEFQIKRDQSLNKLIHSEEHLQQAETLMAEIEPRLKSLTRQVKKLERRDELLGELRQTQLQLYGSEWKELVQLKTKVGGKQAGLNQIVEQTQKEVEDSSRQLDVLAQGASRADLFADLQRQQADLSHKQQKLLREEVVLRGKIELAQEAAGKLNVVFLERKKQDNLQRLQQLAGKKQTSTAAVKTRGEELQVAQRKQVEQLKKLQAVEQQLTKLRHDMERLTHKLSLPEVRDRLGSVFSQQESFLKRLMTTQSLEEFKAVKQYAKEVTEAMSGLLQELREEPNELLRNKEIELARLQQQLEELLMHKDRQMNEVNRLTVEHRSAEHQVVLLQEEWQRVKDETDAVENELSILVGKKNNEEVVVAEEVQAQLKTIEKAAKEVAVELGKVEKHMTDFHTQEEQKKRELIHWQQQREQAQTTLIGVRDQLATISVELARLDTRSEDLGREVEREMSLEDVSRVQQAEVGEVNRSVLREQTQKLKQQLEQIGGIDQEIMNEYNTTKERFEFLSTQVADLRSAIEQLEGVIDELDGTIKKQFSAAIKQIDDEFGKYFKVLFGGGTAHLKLVMEQPVEPAPEPAVEIGPDGKPVTVEEPAHEHYSLGKMKKSQKIIAGVEIEANPPGKKIQSVTVLSGGEKAMTAIALLSAIIASNPPPFVILDEVEAALDESNSEKFSHILQQLSTDTQCIVITHNRATMQAAHTLYGVTMGEDSRSHILSVKMEEAQKLAAQDTQK